MRSAKRVLMLLLSAAVLSGCVVTCYPAEAVLQVVGSGSPFLLFRSDAREYRVGESVTFEVETLVSGYLTLTVADPSGVVSPLIRNLPVFAGRRLLIPGPGSRWEFLAAPPTGWHTVRAHFTPEATSERVTFVGTFSDDGWHAQIALELEPYGFDRRFVAETRLLIRR
jgi:hypothetical protein